MRLLKRSRTIVATALFGVSLVLGGLPALAGSGPGELATLGGNSGEDRADVAATESPTTGFDSDIRFVFAGYLVRFNFLSPRVTLRPITIRGFDRVELSRPRADSYRRTVPIRVRRGFYGGSVRYPTPDLGEPGRTGGRVPLEPE
jgi:hypothetical protein